MTPTTLLVLTLVSTVLGMVSKALQPTNDALPWALTRFERGGLILVVGIVTAGVDTLSKCSDALSTCLAQVPNSLLGAAIVAAPAFFALLTELKNSRIPGQSTASILAARAVNAKVNAL